MPTAATPAPQQGILVPGRSLGGARLGATAAQLRAVWGRAHGVCRSCATRTWYFNYRAFQPQGLGAELRHGRVTALFTVWQPPSWRTREGVRLGDDASRLRAVYGVLAEETCAGYDAFVLGRGPARTVFYVHDGRVWGFGLLAPRVPVCRDG